MNKIHELKTIVNIKKPDIICVTESWTNSNVADAELKIPGYELMARRDRVDTKHGIGGGILIWTRVGLQVRELTAKELEDFNQAVGLTIKVEDTEGKPVPLDIYVIYRPHNLYAGSAEHLQENNEKLRKIMSNKKNSTIWLGDFNMKDINWEIGSAKKANSQDFLTTVQDEFLQQHVDFKTREDSILDLVFSNETDRILKVREGGRIGKSDHEVLDIAVVGRLNWTEPQKEVLDWRRADMEKMRTELSNYEWKKDLEGLDVRQGWELFKSRILKAQDCAVPKKKIRNKQRPPWMTQNILKCVRRKERRWREFRKSRSRKKREL